MKLDKAKIRATARDLERLKRYISEFWSGATITLIEVGGKTLIQSSYYQSAPTVPGYEVVAYRGGFAFVKI